MTDLLQGFLSGSAAWGVLLTLAAFALGALLNKATGKAIFNPLLLGSIFVIILLSAVFEKLFLALLDKAVAAVLGEEEAEKWVKPTTSWK